MIYSNTMKQKALWLLVPLALAGACAAPDPAAVRADCDREIRSAEQAGKVELASELREDCLQPGVQHEPTQGPIAPDSIAAPGLHSQDPAAVLDDTAAGPGPNVDGR